MISNAREKSMITHQMPLITHTKDKIIPLVIRTKTHRLTVFEKNALKRMGDDAIVTITNGQGEVQKISLPAREWSYYGHLAKMLSKGTYHFLHSKHYCPFQLALAFALGAYSFHHFKSSQKDASSETQDSSPKLLVEKDVLEKVQPFVDAIYLVRDLINAPSNFMGPKELEEVAKSIAGTFKGDFLSTKGDDLEKFYPLVHLVGKGAEADRSPLFIEMHFRHPEASKSIALVGKGVCFDSGGLNIKPDAGMLLMKKDMGGAAQILGLTQLLLATNTPINVSVYLPMVENAVDAKSMRPLDIVRSRSGQTVEIGNTDAEGRLILADALTRACEGYDNAMHEKNNSKKALKEKNFDFSQKLKIHNAEGNDRTTENLESKKVHPQSKPDLIIDCATLTGAARVALGPEVPAFFTNKPFIADGLYACSEKVDDPLWQLPLYTPYKESLKASHVDIKNVAPGGYAGAITAALFLEHFIDPTIPWLHLDFMGWNVRSRPSYPEGGEAQGLRALFKFIDYFADDSAS